MKTTIINLTIGGAKVRMNGQVILISTDADENGMYFFNENLEKQYVCDTEFESPKEVEAPRKASEEKEERKEYSFEVEYEHNGRANGFAHTVTTVKAYSYEEAVEKVYKRFKVIYDIAEA